MKSRLDLVRGLIAKADSDLVNATLCITHEQALDTACFHAQQAAEKMLKAYLTQAQIDYPLIHNLVPLVTLCGERDPGFEELLDDAAVLTPFAVELRYDAEFWPSRHDAAKARDAAERVQRFCLERIDLNAD